MIKIQRNNFDFSNELDSFSRKNKFSGSITSFLGKVRKKSTFGDVKFIDIEHYDAMTKKQIDEVIMNTSRKWNIDDYLIIHRYGKINVSENIVLILIASQHRKDSIESLEYIIDWLKVKATFWKKETTENGNFWVTQDKHDLDKLRKNQIKLD